MRKFTLLIASLFIAIGAMAQTVVTTINTDRAYTLECQSGNAHSTTRFIGITDNGVINGQSSTAAYITFETGEENGTYYIKVGEKYLNHDGTTISASTEKSTAWIFNNPYTGLVTFQLPNTTRYLNNNGTDTTDGTVTYLKANNHPSGPSTSNACSTWEMCEYDLDNSVEVTYQYMFNGSMVKEVTVTQAIGSNYAAPAIDYVTFAYPDGTVTAETTTVEVTCTQNLPFTVSTSYTDATWYYMSIRNGGKWVARSESAPYANSTTKTTDDNGLWAFMGNVFDGIQVINKGAGEGYTLGFDATTNASNIYMKEETTSWIIEEGNGGFLLRQAADYEYAHDLNSTLAFWNNASAPTDAGSAFQVYDSADNTDAVEALQAAIDAANTKAENISTELGYYTYTGDRELADAIAEYQEYVNSIESTTTPTPAEVEAKTAELNNFVSSSLTVNLPTAGKYYRLAYDFDGTIKYAQGVASGVASKANALLMTEEKGAASIFYYGDGKLLSYTAGTYVNENSGTRGLMAVGTAGGDASFEAGTVIGKIAVKVPSYMHANTSGDINFVDHCGGAGCAAHNFIIEEVTELPVAVSAAGVATFYTPVALTIPANVECYYIAGAINEKGIVQLTDINSVVPAGNGIVIKATEGTYNFTIGGEATEITGNLLEGTSAATYISKEAYVLANGTNGVGLYKAALTDGAFLNNANKAYFVPSTASGIASYSFNFDWAGTTGIEDVVAEGTQNGKIYDITGREVKAITVPGIYIVNDVKVVVK